MHIGPVNQTNISPGDKVIRGPYWNSGTQDGEPGRVVDLFKGLYSLFQGKLVLFLQKQTQHKLFESAFE